MLALAKRLSAWCLWRCCGGGSARWGLGDGDRIRLAVLQCVTVTGECFLGAMDRPDIERENEPQRAVVLLPLYIRTVIHSSVTKPQNLQQHIYSQPNNSEAGYGRKVVL